MADTQIIVNGIPVLMVDNGDGTYSIGTAAVFSGGGDASAANQEAANALLSTIDGDTSILSAMSVTRNVAVGSSQTGVVPYGIRDDALSALSAAEGAAVLGRYDVNGAFWVQLAGALSSIVDTVGIGLGPSQTAITPINKRFTTAQTGVDLWDPTLARFNIQWIWVTWSGANACRLTIWQGANADTTFTQDTDLIIFDINLDANANGGVYIPFPLNLPWKSSTNDHEVHITTSADKTVSVGIGGFETAS